MQGKSWKVHVGHGRTVEHWKYSKILTTGAWLLSQSNFVKNSEKWERPSFNIDAVSIADSCCDFRPCDYPTCTWSDCTWIYFRFYTMSDDRDDDNDYRTGFPFFGGFGGFGGFFRDMDRQFEEMDKHFQDIASHFEDISQPTEDRFKDFGGIRTGICYCVLNHYFLLIWVVGEKTHLHKCMIDIMNFFKAIYFH